MRKLFFSIWLAAMLLVIPNVIRAHAEDEASDRVGGTSACSPTELQPAPIYTRLGEMRISPDIAAVGEIVNFRVITNEPGYSHVKIELPEGEVVHFEPQTITGGTAAPGLWTGGSDGLPKGEYLVRLRPKYATGGTWNIVQYQIQNFQGEGGGGVSYFVYEDQVPVTLKVGQATPRSNGTIEYLIQTEFSDEHTMVYRTDTGSFRESGGKIYEVDTPNSSAGIRTTLVLESGQQAIVYGRSPDACKEDAFKLDVPPGSSNTTVQTTLGGTETQDAPNRPNFTLAEYIWFIVSIFLLLILGLIWQIRRFMARQKSRISAVVASTAPIQTGPSLSQSSPQNSSSETPDNQ